MKMVHKNNDNPIETLLHQINPNKTSLTPDVLKTFSGCENYTDEQAKLIIETLEKMSAIFYELISNEKINVIDNQQIIYLKNEQKIESPQIIPLIIQQSKAA